jgi:hypothetical protein
MSSGFVVVAQIIAVFSMLMYGFFEVLCVWGWVLPAWWRFYCHLGLSLPVFWGWWLQASTISWKAGNPMYCAYDRSLSWEHNRYSWSAVLRCGSGGT